MFRLLPLLIALAALLPASLSIEASGYIRVDGRCQLDDAIRAANSDRAQGSCPSGYGADTIELTRDITLHAALPAISSDIVILGNGHSIDGDRRHQIFTVEAYASLTIENLSLTRGQGGDEGSLHEGSYKLGGAIFNLGSVTARDSSFIDNYADDAGGAILNNGWMQVTGSLFRDNNARIAAAIDNWSPDATMHISDSEFSNNHAAQFGGAIDNGGSITIERGAFYDNSADSGGAVNNFTALGVSDSIFSGNRARSGGALRNSRDEATMEVSASGFTENKARFGGAISIVKGYATISDSLFNGNEADASGSENSQGGAISIVGEAHISDSAFHDNYAGSYGGAVYIEGQASLRASEFSGNIADQAGGAIYSKGEASLSASSIHYSYAPDGGGIHIADGYFRLRQNILSENARDDCQIGWDGRLSESRDNHISDGSCEPRWSGPAHPGYCPPGQFRNGSCQVGLPDNANRAAAAPKQEPATRPQRYGDGILVDASCSLGDAIRAANLDRESGGCRAGYAADTIILEQDQRLWEALPEISSVITLQGNGHSISGDGRYRIFTIAADGELEINDATLAEGYAADDGQLNLIGDGGAILNLGSLRINRGILRGNRSGEDGGAIRNAGTAEINDSAFHGNSADRQGGAIYSGDASGNPRSASLKLSDSEFSDNSANRHAGAVFADGGLDVISSAFNHNQASVSGGALYNLGQASVSASHFTGNTSGKNGGAIFNDYEAHIHISDSDFRSNSAASGGGGLMSYARASATISDSQFHSNRARTGGGIMVKGLRRDNQTFTGDLYLRNSELSGNAGGDCYIGEYGNLRESHGNVIGDGSC